MKKNEFADLMYVLTEENSEVKNPSKKVTFVESHDTFLNKDGSTREKNMDEIIDEYIELTQKYENTLFYVRDESRGVKLSGNNPNRMSHMDTSWINNEKIRIANLNSGKEYKLEEKEREERKNMNNNISNKNNSQNIHHNICMDIHELMLSTLDKTSPLCEIIDAVKRDYITQSINNYLLGNAQFDEFLMNCVVGEIYGKVKSDINISYREFYIEVLKSFKDSLISELTKEAVEAKIRVLKKEEEKTTYFIYGIG